MRSLPTNTARVLMNAPEDGIKVRDFVWIENIGGSQGWGFYSGAEPVIELEVVSALTNNLELRQNLSPPRCEIVASENIAGLLRVNSFVMDVQVTLMLPEPPTAERRGEALLTVP